MSKVFYFISNATFTPNAVERINIFLQGSTAVITQFIYNEFIYMFAQQIFIFFLSSVYLSRSIKRVKVPFIPSQAIVNIF